MLLKPVALFLLLLIISSINLNARSNHFSKPNPLNDINYSISFARPFTHYCRVSITVNSKGQDSLLFAMPVWTPGSYLIREFARNVEDISAVSGPGKMLPAEKINKNTWKVDTRGADEVTFSYSVYCNELTVRTSEVNIDHAYLNGANVFMFVRGMEMAKCTVNINPYSGWSKISTGLRKESENIYSAENYDILVDSPIEIGNQNILTFQAQGKKHSICLVGEGNYTESKVIEDFKKIVEEEYSLFGELPYEDYTFIIHLVSSNGSGGLEHLNSFTGQTNRWNFTDEKLYKRFLTLVTHEFFHVWNVKRIRPIELGPFNYDEENYTKSLWVAEGWTSLYDNLFAFRCGILNENDYLEFLERDINIVMPYTGRLKQSLEESSFDAWIKLYRKDENFENSEISYYNYGALVSIALNIEIITGSGGKKSLDDALRVLFDDYKLNPAAGYTPQRIKEVCEKLAEKNLDEFWSSYISGTAELPLNEYLNKAGLEMVNKNEKGKAALDVDTRIKDNNIQITKVYAGGSGYEGGLNAGDILISINGMSAEKDSIASVLKKFKTGDVINVTVNRDELTREIKVKLLEALPKYKVKKLENSDDKQKRVWEKWVGSL